MILIVLVLLFVVMEEIISTTLHWPTHRRLSGDTILIVEYLTIRRVGRSLKSMITQRGHNLNWF